MLLHSIQKWLQRSKLHFWRVPCGFTQKKLWRLQRSIQVTLSKLQVVVLIVFFHITPYPILQMEMFTPVVWGNWSPHFRKTTCDWSSYATSAFIQLSTSRTTLTCCFLRRKPMPLAKIQKQLGDTWGLLEWYASYRFPKNCRDDNLSR